MTLSRLDVSAATGDSNGHGMIKRGVTEWEGALRTLKLDLETRIADGTKVGEGMPIWDWFVDQAAIVINRCKVSRMRKKDSPLSRRHLPRGCCLRYSTCYMSKYLYRNIMQCLCVARRPYA